MPEAPARTVLERQEGAAFLGSQGRAWRARRIGKLLDWAPVDRCRLLILVTVPFFAAYALRSHYLVGHPDVEPYYDRGTLDAMRYGLAGACVFWAAFLAWGARERRRPGPHTGYLLVGSLSWWLGVVPVAYALGPITTPAWIAVVIGCVLHLLLLPLRVALVATGAGLVLLLASLVCVMAGLLPYGPAMAETPIVASQMEVPYVLGNTLSSLLATLAVVGIIAYLMTEWRGSLAGLRESEARYRRLTENAFDLIMEVDAGGRSLYASPNHRAVLGYAPDDLVGRVAFDLVHPDERAAVARAFQRMHETSRGHEFEMRVRHQDGGWRWFECSGNAFRVPTGETRAVIVSRDVTERKQAQLQQEKLEAQMLQTQKLESLGVLSGGIAHDFKNLLVPILGNAHLAKQELEPDSPVVRFVERIATAAVRTSELTDQLLAYAGRGTLTARPLDLGELLREMGELLRTAVSRRIAIAYDLADTLPSIEGDAVQLRQVVLNLIINASEAIGDRPGAVTIGAGTIEIDGTGLRESYLGGELADGSYVCLDVSDDGCGMDEETRSRIFDPFFTTKFTGRGLGLAALLGIVRAHRGAVRVDSEPGRGTRFRLLFPVASGSPETLVETAPRAAPWHRSGTVLFGDDEEGVREFAEEVLARCGLSVIAAEDGHEAVRLFREHAPRIDAVVLDVTMPGLGGVEAVARIRKIRPDVCLLLSSGYTEAEVAPRFRGGEVDGFLQKPYAPEALVRKLRELLEG